MPLVVMVAAAAAAKKLFCCNEKPQAKVFFCNKKIFQWLQMNIAQHFEEFEM